MPASDGAFRKENSSALFWGGLAVRMNNRRSPLVRSTSNFTLWLGAAPGVGRSSARRGARRSVPPVPSPAHLWERGGGTGAQVRDGGGRSLRPVRGSQRWG